MSTSVGPRGGTEPADPPAPVKLGAFARIWSGNTLSDIAAFMAAAELSEVQWNFSAVGLPTVHGALTDAAAEHVQSTFADAGLAMWGLSCTFNAIDPDPDRLKSVTKDAVRMIRAAPSLGVQAVTICTGSADANNMWAPHPDNDTEASWTKMRATVDALLDAAANAGVLIAVEPENGNVVRDAARAERLLNEVGTDAPLGFILDSANLLTTQTLPQQNTILSEAFAGLGPKTVCLHAKDVVLHGDYAAPGRGGLDFDLVARLHQEHAASAPVIIQDTNADDIGRVVSMLRETWSRAAA